MKRNRNKARRKRRQLKKVKRTKARANRVGDIINGLRNEYKIEWSREFLKYSKLQFGLVKG